MPSTQKTLSTLVKSGFKKVLNRTLLTFPGGEKQPLVACVFCPEMCRFSCPTAVSTGDDTVTPLSKMSLIYHANHHATEKPGDAGWPIFSCTGCGRCTEYCKYEMPVADRIFEARSTSSALLEDRHRLLTSIASADQDPYGELAYELGFKDVAFARMSEKISNRHTFQTIEPKTFHYLKHTVPTFFSLSPDVLNFEMDSFLTSNLSTKMWEQLGKRNYLVVESPWYSRHLDRSESVREWISDLNAAAGSTAKAESGTGAGAGPTSGTLAGQSNQINFVFPFASGYDCIDSGGEGTFQFLQPDVAKEMALDVWNRDKDRTNAVLTFSIRARDHFISLGVEAIAVQDLMKSS